MTDLRDARLQRALEEAPDAGLRPAPATRDAIRSAAQAAVRPWWRRLLPPVGGPWAPALATVLVAGLVTVLWHGRDVPGPGGDGRLADQPAPRPPAASAVPSGPAVPPAPAPPAAALPAPQLSPAPGAAPPVPAAETRTRAVAPVRRPTPAPTPAPAPAPVPAPPAADAAPPAVTAEAVPASAAAAAAGPRESARALARSAAPAAAAPTAPVPDAWMQWTQARLESNGDSVVVPRDQAGELPHMLARMLWSAQVVAAPAGGARLKIELARDREPIGVLESVDGLWRWRPLGDAQPARGLRPTPTLDAQLREEAQRLLRR